MSQATRLGMMGTPSGASSSVTGTVTLRVSVSEVIEGLYRVADTAIEQYELYVGEDASPTFTNSPDATSAALPFTYTPTPPVSGTKAYHLVTRFRNRYNLLSLNARERIIELDSGGAEQDPPPNEPQNVELEASGAGGIKVTASYYFSDDSTQADEFVIYAKVGSDPVPGTDSPVATVSMTQLSAVALLDTTITGYSDGDDVRVLVRTNISGSSTESTNTTATAVAAVNSTLTISSTSSNLGGKYEQQ